MKNVKAFGVILAFCSLLVIGCVTTRQARGVKPSAFLGDAVSLLKEGKGDDQVSMRYINPNVNWKKYNSVIIEPVTYWVGTGEKDGINEEERKALTNYFDAVLRVEIAKREKVVDVNSAPDAMRLSYALIKAEHSWPALATVSSLVPMAIAMSTLKTIVTGKPSFVGEIQGEVKITDSVTGELLAAGADKRVGGMGWKGKFNRWEAVEASSRFWAEQTRYRLCVLQSQSDCKKPSDY